MHCLTSNSCASAERVNLSPFGDFPILWAIGFVTGNWPVKVWLHLRQCKCSSCILDLFQLCSSSCLVLFVKMNSYLIITLVFLIAVIKTRFQSLHRGANEEAYSGIVDCARWVSKIKLTIYHVGVTTIASHMLWIKSDLYVIRWTAHVSGEGSTRVRTNYQGTPLNPATTSSRQTVVWPCQS